MGEPLSWGGYLSRKTVFTPNDDSIPPIPYGSTTAQTQSTLPTCHPSIHHYRSKFEGAPKYTNESATIVNNKFDFPGGDIIDRHSCQLTHHSPTSSLSEKTRKSLRLRVTCHPTHHFRHTRLRTWDVSPWLYPVQPIDEEVHNTFSLGRIVTERTG